MPHFSPKIVCSFGFGVTVPEEKEAAKRVQLKAVLDREDSGEFDCEDIDATTERFKSYYPLCQSAADVDAVAGVRVRALDRIADRLKARLSAAKEKLRAATEK